MPMLTANASPTIVKPHEILGTFTENTMIEKLTSGFHPVGAMGLHANLLLKKAFH